jgi:tetratricopeptide (TPR) repeat protein
VIIVAVDSKGWDVLKPFLDAANVQHPSLLDRQFLVAELYNTKNVPAAFWIDEQGRIMRANDPIYAQRRNRETGETTTNDKYLDAVRDWVAKGPDSIFVTQPDETGKRMGEPDMANAQAMVHFRLGTYLQEQGRHEEAVEQLKRAHELKPDNWNFKRQAWNLGNIEQDFGTTFQQELQKGIPFYPPLDLPEAGA